MEHLLESLRKEKINISLKGDDLKIRFDGEKIPDHLLSALKENKAQLVTYLKEHAVSNRVSIPKATVRKDGYPLSSAQSSLWVLCQMEEASVAYNMSFSLSMVIENVELFKKAVEAVIDRHEALRTVFRNNEEGELRQWIFDREELNFEIKTIDLRDHHNRDREVRSITVRDSQKPFDLGAGPLLRAFLLQLDTNQYVFYYCLHHIICDGWSLDVLSKDAMGQYRKNLNNEQQEVAPLAIQYKDYATWQQEQLLADNLNSQREYWINKLAGELPVLDLPTDKQRPKIKTYNGNSLGVSVPEKVVAKLNKVVEQFGGSLFMALLAGLQTSLSYYTGETDICVGTPVSGRNHPDLEPQIGFYLNVLVMRTQISWEQSYEQLYADLKNDMIENLKNQSYPFDHLITHLDVQRDVSRSPLFDILMDYHGQAEAILKNDSEGIIEMGSGRVKYDIELHAYEVGNAVQLILNYNSDVYEDDTVRKFLSYYLRLLEKMDFTAPLKQFQGLTKNEEKLLARFSKGENTTFPHATILECFEVQVSKNPEDTAVSFGEEQLSYGELDRVSNQLANGLIDSYNVKPSQVVALHFDPNHYTVVAILAILKAGACYLFVDTELPPERKMFLLNDAKVELLITETSHMFDLNEFDGTLFTIDVEFESEWKCDGINLAAPSDLAYLIYTSGSTGTPKGVEIGHAALSNYVQWAASYYSDEGNVALNFGLFTTLGFDLTVTSLFLPLVSGGTLTIMENEDISQQLKHYLEASFNCIKLTPAHLGLLPALEITNSAVAVAIVGGDVLHPHHIEILKKINPSMKVYNEYGPTEATVGCIVTEVHGGEAVVPIGRPIANMEVLILNDQLRLTPPGVSGELYLSGVGLAEGYYQRPELTEACFLEWNGQRVYKTGDRCSWRQDGNMVYEGRKDEQVKIQGYRIELGEIAARLRKKPSVNDAVVMTQLSSSGEAELVGYLVSTSEENTAELRSFLQDSLPAYMIPSHFVTVSEIPLNKNGKVDKKRLVLANSSRLDSGLTYVAPEDETEKKICDIWSEVLEDQKIGRNHDFFLLGGNSLLAIKLINAYQKEFHVKVSLTEIFTKSTLVDHKALLTSKMNQKKEEIETLEF